MLKMYIVNIIRISNAGFDTQQFEIATQTAELLTYRKRLDAQYARARRERKNYPNKRRIKKHKFTDENFKY